MAAISREDIETLKKILRGYPRTQDKPVGRRAAEVLKKRRKSAETVEEDFQRLIPTLLKPHQSVNSISNKDLKILENTYLNRNDGGIAKKTRVF